MPNLSSDDLEANIQRIAKALENDDPKEGLTVVLTMVETLLRDVRRIANALEEIAADMPKFG